MMAVVRCEICENFIDLDYSVECIREELEDHVVCEKCMDEHTEEELRETLEL